MHEPDLTRLSTIAFGEIQPASRDEHLAASSPLRMQAAARVTMDHSVRFNLDGTTEGTALPAATYIASLIADLATLAEQVEPGTGAQDVLEHAVSFLADSDPAIQVRLG